MALALYLGMLGLEISVDFLGWCLRLGLLAEEGCWSLGRFISLVHWHLVTCLILAVWSCLDEVFGCCVVCEGFAGELLDIGQKLFCGQTLDFKGATALQMGHSNVVFVCSQ